MRLLASCLVVVTAFPAAVYSQRPFSMQDTLEGMAVRGEIVHPSGSSVGNLMVELTDSTRGSITPKMVVAANGEFEFSSVPPGQYFLHVYTISGAQIYEQIVDVRDAYLRLQIQLPGLAGSKPGTGTISAAQLLHRVPNKAKKEFDTAQKYFRKKDVDSGIQHLQCAVQIDPQFSEAQEELGRCYIQKHQAQKVVDAFSQVLKMNPRSASAYSGMSLGLLWLRRLPEAEHAAREAVSIDGASPIAHYLLGMSLAAQDKELDEALEHLKRSSVRFPNAHLASAQILARRGDLAPVESQLEDYLKTGSTDHRSEVQSWLARIKAGN